MRFLRPKSSNEFEIALLCALESEANALHAIFDIVWDDDISEYPLSTGDNNAYTMGIVGNHNVVMAYIPGMGKVNAAMVTSGLQASFPGVKLALLVGICGAVPFPPGAPEIFLGDLIISTNIVQYDFGRRFDAYFERKDTIDVNLGRPNHKVRSILEKLRTQHYRKQLQDNLVAALSSIQQSLSDARCPDVEHDRLYAASYYHVHRHSSGGEICLTCDSATGRACSVALKTRCEIVGCDPDNLVRDGLHRTKALGGCTEPRIYFGKIGSSDTVLKSAHQRDLIADRDGVIAFEMEGAGVWDHLPTLVVKAVCDYADAHKDKQWQSYAAAVAAAGTKALLQTLKPERKLADYDHGPWSVDNRLHDAIVEDFNKTGAGLKTLIKLTVEGLRLIPSIRLQYQGTDYAEPLQIFSQELLFLERLFGDIRGLCERVHLDYGGSGVQMQVTSMRIHLEDIVNELAIFLRTAEIPRKSKHQGTYSNSGPRRDFQSQSAKNGSFLGILQRLLHVSPEASNASQCTMIESHFSRQRENMKTAFSLLQSELLLIESEPSDTERRRLRQTGRIEHRQPGKQVHQQDSGNNSEEYHSGSSLLAYSMTHDERLREIQSMHSDLSHKLERLTQTLSDSDSHNSGFSKLRINDASRRIRKAVPSLTESHLPKQIALSTNDIDENRSFQDVQGHNEVRDAEHSKLLLDALSEMDIILDQCFDSVIVDYIRAVQHWQILDQRQKLCQILKDSHDSQDTKSSHRSISATFRAEMKQCSSSVLSLQKKAVFELLEHEIEKANLILSFSGAQILRCEEFAKQGDGANRLDLTRIRESDPATLLNEWFLKELFENQHLIELHRQMLAQSDVAVVGKQHQGKIDLLEREPWERRVLKSWFMDKFRLAEHEYANTRFTEQTAVPIEREDTLDFNSPSGLSVANEVTDMGEVVLFRQPAYKGLYLPKGGIKTLIEQPSEHFSPCQLQRAQQTVETYRSEQPVSFQSIDWSR